MVWPMFAEGPLTAGVPTVAFAFMESRASVASFESEYGLGAAAALTLANPGMDDVGSVPGVSAMVAKAMPTAARSQIPREPGTFAAWLNKTPTRLIARIPFSLNRNTAA